MRKIGIGLLAVLALLLLPAVNVLSRKRPEPIRSTTHATLRRTDCIACHAPIAEEWRQSFHYRSLTGPHWSEVRRLGYLDVRRSHRFVGDKDEAMLRNAVHASLRISGPSEARFRIINDRVGHYFPSGGNWVRVFFTTYDAANRKVAERVEGLGRDEGLILPIGSDKRLAYGEQKEFVISLPVGHGHIDATVRYHDFIRLKRPF